MTLTVCTLVKDQAHYLEKMLDSVSDLATEITVAVDDQTTDDSLAVAKRFTDKVFLVPHKENFHINKQFILEKSTQDWILWMDSDEEVTPELKKEIRKILALDLEGKQFFSGFKIPRKNFIFGKWIQHTGWYPDYQVRLFKKGTTHFPCKSLHEDPEIKGEVGNLDHPMIHHNYQTVKQFLNKLNHYTDIDSENLKDEIKKPFITKVITRPFDEFVKRFVVWQGYRDGLHGLALSLLQAFYELVVVLKVWEKSQFRAEEVSLSTVNTEIKKSIKTWHWWQLETKIKETKSKGQKIYYKVLRKIGI